MRREGLEAGQQGAGSVPGRASREALREACDGRRPGTAHHAGERLRRVLPQALACVRDDGESPGGHLPAEPRDEGLVAHEDHESQRTGRNGRHGEQRHHRGDGLLDGRRVCDPGAALAGGRDARQEGPDPLVTDGHRGYDADAQTLGEDRCVDADAAGGGFVDHVEAQDMGDPHLRELNGQQQRSIEVLRVGNHHHRLGPPIEQHVASHALVLRRREEGGGARGVDDGELAAVHDDDPGGDLHRGARVVRDRGVLSREGAEERALADVGVADEHDA